MIDVNEEYVDDLHQIINDLNSGAIRLDHLGRTAMCVELLLGEVELGDDNNSYCYVCETIEHARVVGKEFMQTANDRLGEDTIKRQSSTLYYNSRGQRFTFGIVSQPEVIRGMAPISRVFLDLSSRTQHQIMVTHEHPFYTAIVPALLPNGDVV